MLKGKTPLVVALVLGLFAGLVAWSAIKKKESDVRRGWNLVPVVVAAVAGSASAQESNFRDLIRKYAKGGDAAAADFDFWLRADGNRRNPGATADLVAAALFAGLRDGLLPPPWR